MTLLCSAWDLGLVSQVPSQNVSTQQSSEQGLVWWGVPGIGIGGNRAHRWNCVGKISSSEQNHSVTFRLPPEHTIDPTALFLSSCPVKCNDPEVNFLHFHCKQFCVPSSQMSPNLPFLRFIPDQTTQCMCVREAQKIRCLFLWIQPR